jgi:hypothetical protein
MTSICTSKRARHSVATDEWYMVIGILKDSLAEFLGRRQDNIIVQQLGGIARLACVDRGTRTALVGCQINIQVLGIDDLHPRARRSPPRSCDRVLLLLQSGKWVCRELCTRNTTCRQIPSTVSRLRMRNMWNPIDITNCPDMRTLVLERSDCNYANRGTTMTPIPKTAHCPELEHLRLSGIWDLYEMQTLLTDTSLDNVRSINVELCTGLSSMYCGEKLRHLRLSGPVNMKCIDLRSAPCLTRISLGHMDAVTEIDLSSALGLVDIQLSDMNAVTHINLRTATNLHGIMLACMDALTQVDFGIHRELHEVRLSNLPVLSAVVIPETGSGQLWYFRMLVAPLLTKLCIPPPSISLRLRGTPMLGESQLTSLITDTLEELTLCDCGALKSLTLGPSLIDLQLAFLPTLSELNCTAALNLERLKVKVLANVVGAIDVSGCMQLKYIDLGLDPMLRLESPGQGLDERSADIAGSPVTPVLVDQLEEWYNANHRHWRKGIA